MVNIQDSEECETEINKPMDLLSVKLTRFKEVGLIINIIAIQPIDTKFGKSYILLDDEGRRTLGNKKINDFCDCRIVVHSKSDLKEGCRLLQSNTYHYNNGEILFFIKIGDFSEYKGHKYNEIKVILNNWSLSKEDFEKHQIKSKLIFDNWLNGKIIK